MGFYGARAIVVALSEPVVDTRFRYDRLRYPLLPLFPAEVYLERDSCPPKTMSLERSSSPS